MRHGALRLNALLNIAQPFGSWYSRHGGHGYKFKNDGIYQGNDHLANYQAIQIEDIRKDDGVGFTFDFDRAILVRCRLPLGHALTERVVIKADDWADQRQAMNIIRANLPVGASFDEGPKTLRAIKELSLQGDGPGNRVVFTVTDSETPKPLLCYRWGFIANGQCEEFPRHAQGSMPKKYLCGKCGPCPKFRASIWPS